MMSLINSQLFDCLMVGTWMNRTHNLQNLYNLRYLKMILSCQNSLNFMQSLNSQESTRYQPIIPCNNNITEPASKVVSKMLKSPYLHYPTILKGTKGLAQKLQHITLQQGQKAFMDTGDIVAYYPNILVKQAVPIILRMFMKYAARVGLPQNNKHTNLYVKTRGHHNIRKPNHHPQLVHQHRLKVLGTFLPVHCCWNQEALLKVGITVLIVSTTNLYLLLQHHFQLFDMIIYHQSN